MIQSLHIIALFVCLNELIDLWHKDHQIGKEGKTGSKDYNDIAHGFDPLSLPPCYGIVINGDQMGCIPVKPGRKKYCR